MVVLVEDGSDRLHALAQLGRALLVLGILILHAKVHVSPPVDGIAFRKDSL